MHIRELPILYFLIPDGNLDPTELYYISGDCALIQRQSTNCNQKHGGLWPNLRHFDVTISLFSCRAPLTQYIIGKNHTKT